MYERQEWSTSADLVLLYETQNYLPPTVVSPLISRRYKIRLCIKTLEYGYATMMLELPLQVLYESQGQPCSGARELSEIPSVTDCDVGSPPPYFR